VTKTRTFGGGFLAAVAVAALVLAWVPVARGEVTVGQVAPPDPPASCSSGPFEVFANSSINTATYTVPANGLITSWATSASTGDGQELEFKVYRPLGESRYRVVGQDGPRALIPSVLNVFETAIPVQAGDLIGNNDTNATAVHDACVFETGIEGDQYGYFSGSLPVGEAFETEGSSANFRPNVSATLLPLPTVTAIAPASGPIGGGTSVVINGSSFFRVRQVSFGRTPASFSIGSEGQITAIAPASTHVGAAAVSVTTDAGTASSATPFLYKGCTVPKLQGKKLGAARKALKKAGCKAGKVKKAPGVTGKTGKVVKQGRKPGKVLPPGTAVNLKLGR
jgi:hypothetical protein